MAESIGGKIRNIAVGILIGFLVIGFAIWGVSDVFTARATNAVLTVGDEEISTQEFDDAFRQELRTLGQDSGQALTNEEAYNQGVHRKVLQQLMTDAIIGVDADDLGIGVNRKSARQVVEEIPAFKDELTGKFSETKLDSLLAQNRITRQDFENDIYRSLRRQQTVPAIIGGLQAPSAYGAQRYKFLTEQRKAEVLTIDANTVADPADPDDETLKSYIAANAATYTAPEYRQFTILRVENFDVTPDLTVSDEDIEAAFIYKQELGEIGSPEKRSLVQITADDEETAKTAAARLMDGEDPAFVSTSLGLIEPQIYTDSLKDDIIDPETADIAFAMEKGEAKTILGSLGFWYAVSVTDITEKEVPDLEANRDEIITSLENDLAEEQIYDITAEIEDAMVDGSTLEEAAAKGGVSVASLDFISRRGVTQDSRVMDGISVIPGVSKDEIILTEIFTNDIGYETDLFQTSTGGWAAIRVDDIIDSQMRPFEEVKADATAAWKTGQINEALDAKMLELAGKAQTGESLQSIADEIGTGASIDDVILVRSTPSQQVGPLVNVGLLEASVGDIKRGEGPKPLTRQIARLDRISANTDIVAGRFEDVIQEQINSAISADIQNAYQNAILKEYPLREYPEKVKSTLGVDN